MDFNEIMQMVARGWCQPETSKKEMDVELATAISKVIQREIGYKIYVIGTCGDCKYWEGEKEEMEPNCSVPSEWNNMEMYSEKNFGCIHYDFKGNMEKPSL